MFGVSHKKPNGSFVNDEAKKKNVSAVLKFLIFIVLVV
jgi:hypothetical protein